jgi:hypothetical protein
VTKAKFKKAADAKEPGPKGDPGKQGLTGARGAKGADGLDGADGPRGVDGLRGRVGPKGDTGDVGADGKQGLTGTRGAPGQNGTNGLNGVDGKDGLDGDRGEKGDTGSGGDQGLGGARGAPGQDGWDGRDGTDGRDGKKGETGEAGPQGKAGVKGAKGAKGTKGDDGPQGKQGEEGEQGPRGWTGGGGGGWASGSGNGDASPRDKGIAVLNTDVAANTTISTSTNATGTFLDYSVVTFSTEVEIHINGVLMRCGANSGSNYDVYPAGTAADGDFACEFALKDTDVIQMFIGGGGGAAGAHDMGGILHTSGTELATRIVEADGLGGTRWVDRPSGSATWLEDAYTPTLGQVTFILSQTPTEPISLSLHANGIEAVETVDYTLSGLTLTWLNTEFSFETDDGVVIQYK